MVRWSKSCRVRKESLGGSSKETVLLTESSLLKNRWNGKCWKYMKISKATIRFFAGLNEECLQHNGGQSCHKRVVHPQPFPATWPRAPKGESEQPPSHSHELQTSRTPITATLRALYGLLIGFVDRDWRPTSHAISELSFKVWNTEKY